VPTPPDILADLRSSDDAAPRITWYDLGDGPTAGERVELSARVLANWVAKAANALRDEWDVQPGDVVALDLPPHWRSLYWAFAVWSVGAGVLVGSGAPGTEAVGIVTTDPGHVDRAPDAALVTLAALARGATEPVPPGVMDEARELATHGDVFAPGPRPAKADPLLVEGERVRTHGDLVGELSAFVPGRRVHTATSDLGEFLRVALSAFAAGGSVVLTRDGSADVIARVLADERVG
jgi:uncharacterized protein (TIGR03089 family)